MNVLSPFQSHHSWNYPHALMLPWRRIFAFSTKSLRVGTVFSLRIIFLAYDDYILGRKGGGCKRGSGE